MPRILHPPPGPRSRRLSRRLRELEAPGINTLGGGGPNILWREALGANVLDVDGNRYIDLTSGFGVAAVGHRHPRVMAAVRRQAGRLVHGLGDAAGHEPRIELAARLTRLVPVSDAQLHLAVSGSDAVEIALKTALMASGEARVLVFEPAYHGLTLGALAATSRPAFRRPAAPHLHHQQCRLPFGCSTTAIANELRQGGFACVLVEPFVGREGVLLPPPGWLHDLGRLCRRHRTLLIADEIFTGFGRTGRRFAVDHDGVRPDLICCGKALAGGLPIGAVLGSRDLMAVWATPSEALHTATFVAHPLACAAAVTTLEVLESERLAERAARLGRDVSRRMSGWPRRFEALAEVRGLGLMWGLELDSAANAAHLVHGARERGILVLAGGPEGRVVQMVPPLTIRERQLRTALALIEETLTEVIPPK